MGLQQLCFVQNFRMNFKNPGVELSVRTSGVRWLSSREEMLRPSITAVFWKGPSLQALSHPVSFMGCPEQNGKKGCVYPNQGNSMCDYCKRNLDFGIS